MMLSLCPTPVKERRQLKCVVDAALTALAVLGLPRPKSVEVGFARWRGEEGDLPGGGLLINE